MGIVSTLNPMISLLLYHTGGVSGSRQPVKMPFTIMNGIKEIIM